MKENKVVLEYVPHVFDSGKNKYKTDKKMMK